MDKVLVINFGAQYAELIARRIRQLGIFSIIKPCNISINEIKEIAPKAIVFTGGPDDIRRKGALNIKDKEIFNLGIPILGICYGCQMIAYNLGGKIEKCDIAEYGSTKINLTRDPGLKDTDFLLDGFNITENVWMSHAIGVYKLPAGFKIYANSKSSIACFGNAEKKIYAVQWHPEASHSAKGQTLLSNFLINIAKITPSWKTDIIAQDLISDIKHSLNGEKAICALSGGVDSAVAATLVSRAIKDDLICVFVDTGLLREGEAEQVQKDFKEHIGLNLITVDKSKEFLDALKGVTDPEEKRKIIGEKFIRTFEEVAKNITKEQKIKYLVQGTLYPDIIESAGGDGSANIKSHHNVGGLPKDLDFELIEPLKSLFKDEVRQIGLSLGVPENIVYRHPFPGPGLAVRIIGEVTSENLGIVRKADKIFNEEMISAGLYNKIWQAPVVLLSTVRSVGISGDERSFGHPIVLRPVVSEDAMSADFARIDWDILATISNRITNEIEEINRVVLDISSKPPGTIEWE